MEEVYVTLTNAFNSGKVAVVTSSSREPDEHLVVTGFASWATELLSLQDGNTLHWRNVTAVVSIS